MREVVKREREQRKGACEKPDVMALAENLPGSNATIGSGFGNAPNRGINALAVTGRVREQTKCIVNALSSRYAPKSLKASCGIR
jgi:hypothetical protein